jgi:hypothetical protein
MKRIPSFLTSEVLITLSLFVLLFSIQIPTISTFWKMRILEIQSNQLLQDIELVRSLSLEKRETLKMEFYGAGNYYRFETDQGGMGVTARYIQRSFTQFSGFPLSCGISPVSYTDETGSLVQGSINFGGAVSDLYGTLAFNNSGIPSAGGHIVIISKNLNKGLVIIVKPVTGRARIGRVLLHFTPAS